MPVPRAFREAQFFSSPLKSMLGFSDGESKKKTYCGKTKKLTVY